MWFCEASSKKGVVEGNEGFDNVEILVWLISGMYFATQVLHSYSDLKPFFHFSLFPKLWGVASKFLRNVKHSTRTRKEEKEDPECVVYITDVLQGIIGSRKPYLIA